MSRHCTTARFAKTSSYEGNGCFVACLERRVFIGGLPLGAPRAELGGSSALLAALASIGIGRRACDVRSQRDRSARPRLTAPDRQMRSGVRLPGQNAAAPRSIAARSHSEPVFLAWLERAS